MQAYGLSRLTSHTMKGAVPVFRKLLQTEAPRTSSSMRFLSSAGGQQDKSNDDSKKNMTNLIYLVGGLTGAGMIYSVFRNRKSSEEKKEAISRYDSSKTTATTNDTQDQNLLDKEDEPETIKREDLSPHIPNFAQYLIIGGGTTAMSAFKTIRAHDEKAKVLVISSESYMPYMRPPLSKDIWYTDDEDLLKRHSFKQWNGKEKSLYYFDDEFYADAKTLNEQENGGVAIVRGRKVVQLDLKNSVAKLDNGWEVSFEKCLIATGGQPKNLKIFQTLPNRLKHKITLYRGIDDFTSLKRIVDSGASIAIVGGGFLGSELACALGHRAKERAKDGKPSGKVIQLMQEKGNISKVLPEYLSKWTSDRVRDEGAEVIANVDIVNASMQDGKINIAYINSSEPHKTSYIAADHVVVAVGIDANTDLAASGGLEIDPIQGGYLVNAELQARHNVWVAGDAASFYDIKLGRRRVEHHDHAIVSGKLAGENMTGAHKPYWHQSMFWSDLGPKIGFEAIGLTDSNLHTVAVYAQRKPEEEVPQADSEGNREQKEDAPASTTDQSTHSTSKEESTTIKNKNDYNKGVVFYVKDNKVVGVVLWNVFNRIPIARKIIKDQQEVTDFQELAKLFNIHQD